MSKINLSFTVEGFEFKTPDGDCKLPKLNINYNSEFTAEESEVAMKGFTEAFNAGFKNAFEATQTQVEVKHAETPATTEVKTDEFCEVPSEETSNNVEFGKLYMNKDNGIPTLEVIACGRTYYMSWFRGYRIQISGTMDGSGDYGSSPVMHYKETFGGMPYNIQTSIIDMAAMHAINRFCQYGGRGLVPPYVGYGSIYMKWLDETVKYTFKTDKSNIIVDDDYYREVENGVWEEIPYEERKAAREAAEAEAKAKANEE